MDAITQKLLNDFSKSQPALQLPGKPYAIAGIQLGDLIVAAGAAQAPAAHVDPIGALATVAGTVGDPTAALVSSVNTRLGTIQAKVDAVIASLIAAGLMS